jgi:predicted nucleotidyltransferase
MANAEGSRVTLLQQRDSERYLGRERMREEMRQRLRRALVELAPAPTAIVFGSLVKPGRFSETSDVDVALTSEPAEMTTGLLSSLLAERLGRQVDVVLLFECRFRDRILREGETWTLSD